MKSLIVRLTKTFLSPKFYGDLVLSQLCTIGTGVMGVITVDYFIRYRNELEWRTERTVDTVWSLGSFGVLLSLLYLCLKGIFRPYRWFKV